MDEMLRQWTHLLQTLGDDPTSARAGKIWDLVASNVTGLNARMQAIFPHTHAEAVAAVRHPLGVVGPTSGQYTRSIEWLQRHGMCIDHMQVQPSQHVPYQHGAFARRPIPKGRLVSPVPLVPTSREHVVMNGTDGTKFQQLIMNYCYGHPDSSLLLVPDAPGVNAINHGNDTQANVALRWSTRHTEQLEQLQHQSPHDILASGSTYGLVLELYALRDLQVGEEILLNYGSAWERTWQRHDREWQLFSSLENNNPDEEFATFFDYESDFPVSFDDHSEGMTTYHAFSYPSHLQARCWMDVESLRHSETDTWQPFVPIRGRRRLDWSTPCHIESVRLNHETGLQEFRATVYISSGDNEKLALHVRDVPKAAIVILDHPYTGQQFHRRAFRHEIHLSDDLFPEAWKDLAPPSKCGLYLAESTIPNAGVSVGLPPQVGSDFHL